MAYQFPLNGGRINASVGGNSTSAGAGYQLVSTGTLLLAGGNNITLSQNANSISVAGPSLSNSNGFTFGTNGSVVTASYAGGGSVNFSAGTTSSNLASVTFANGNGVSFGLNGGTITGTVATNYAASNHSHGNPSLNLTNMSGTTASASNGLTLSLSAPAVSSLSNTGIVSLSTEGSTIMIGAPAFSAGISSNSTVTNQLILAAGNNITLSQSTNAAGATLSISGANALTSQSNQAMSAGNGSFAFQTASFSNANGISFSTTAGSAIVASHNGITSQSAQTANLYVSSNSTQLSSTAGVDLRSMTFQGAGGVSVGVSGGKVLISGGAGGGGGIALANSQTTYTSGTANLNASGALTIASTTGQQLNFSAPATSLLSGGNGISISTNGSTVVFQAASAIMLSSFVNILPASSGSQTFGAMGVTTGSAQFYPVSLDSNIQFNAIRVAMNMSFATSTISGQQTISHSFGLYSNNANTLSQISSGSLSYGVTNSSVSATLSAATSTGTGGYGYGTITASTTAQIHSNFGTVGLRAIDLQFGNTMSLAPGMYWLGFLRRESSSSANIGLSMGLAGNVVTPMKALGIIGSHSGALTTNFALKSPYMGFGPYTSTASAGYGGTALPSSVFISGIAHTGSIMPFMTFIGT